MSNGYQSAMTKRSLRTVKSELEFLADSNVITQQQYNAILAQLPADGSSNVTSPAAADPTPQMASLNLNSSNEKRQNGYFAPSPNVQPQDHTVPPPAYPRAPQPPSALCYATALYAYAATDAGDLDLFANDRVEVTEYMNAEWWKGRSQRTGEEGIFPRSYVKVEETKGPSTASAAPYKRQASTSTNYGNVPLQVSQSGGGPSEPRQPGKGEEMGKKFGKKLGNAAVFGAGATIGGKIVNGIF